MNMPSVLKVIVAVFFLSILPMSANALTPSQVFDKVKDSVVVVKTLDGQVKVKVQGSGVLISAGRIATNCHVVEGGISYQVGRGTQLVSATLYAEDGDKDICILDAKGIAGKPVQLGKAADLKVGVPVYAVGAPQGLELSLSDGIVAQLRGGPPPLIQTTAAISPGSSGGGLFDGEGRLVGLTTLYMKGGQSLNFAMPVEWISEVKPGRKTVAKEYGQTEWFKRLLFLEQTKDWQGLLDLCQRWTKNEPEKAEVWNNLGVTYARLSRYDDAIESYRQALRINPELAGAWNNLGVAYAKLKRYDDAIEAYRQAIRIDPELAGGWYTLTWNNLGDAYDELKRYKDAVDAYRQAVRIDPEYADAWHGLGNAYSNLERYNDAIEAYRQAILVNPKDAYSWSNLGTANLHLNRPNDAIEAFRQAVRIDPDNAITWWKLGFTYYFIGNRTAAMDVVRELRRLKAEEAETLFNQIVPR